ncbi:flagellar export protein FliJ [Thermodesulfitimonas autotrophica]|uniref:flagellar export protein FliJ n=1 Tax=Thermodesulfitimonas autotrophica TaxID=1894989 RepID=UPI002FE2E821
MGRFNFRLEPVLKYRAVKEERYIQTLAEAQRRLEEKETAYKSCAAEYQASLEGNGRTLAELQQWAVYRQLLRERLKAEAAKLKEAIAQVDECRAAVLSARQERLTVEKVKERRYAAFLAEEGYKERRQYDELSQLAFQNREKSHT